MPKSPEKSLQISSNFTLLFKIALPVFWTVFFGGFAVSALTTDMYRSFNMSAMAFRTMTTLFFLSGVLFLYFTFWQLKRVEFSPDTFYVSDYFKHYRYGYGMIQSIHYINLIFFRLMIIELTQKGHFGKKIPLIISRKRHRIHIEALPERSKRLGMH